MKQHNVTTAKHSKKKDDVPKLKASHFNEQSKRARIPNETNYQQTISWHMH